MSLEIFLAIVIMSLSNFLTRAVPFIFFSKYKPPKIVLFVGEYFPPIIMSILICYTLTNTDLKNQLYGLKEILAIFLTAYLHIKYKNFLVSIFSGTIFYMMITQYL